MRPIADVHESFHPACAAGVAAHRDTRTRWTLIVLLLSAWLLVALPARAGTPEPFLFESSAPGLAGGGLSLSGTHFHGISFRLTERVRVSEIGGQLSSFQPATIYGAIYALGTPSSPAYVLTDSNLVATALLDMPGGNAPAEISTAMDVELEPGWYAVGFGTGRHGSPTSQFSATMNATGNPKPARTYGPWTMNMASGSMVLQQTSVRIFLRGQPIEPAPVDPTRFLWQTVEPWAWGVTAYYRMDNQNFAAQRFTLNRPTRIDRVGVWGGYMGHGTGFVAIFPLQSANDLPPHPNDPLLEQKALASALITSQSFTEELFADFGGIELPPGHYGMIVGSGRFGADGAIYLVYLEDGVIVPTTLRYEPQFPGWLNLTSVFSMRVTGLMAEIAMDTDVLDFGDVLVDDGSRRTVTITNYREHGPLAIELAYLSGDDAMHFDFGIDIADCASIAVGASCSFSIDYRPQAAGPHVAVMTIISDGIPDPVEVQLSGSGLASAWVTPGAQGNGSIQPDVPQLTAIGDNVAFSLTPAEGHHVADVEGSCGGTLDGLVFNTAGIAADCSVTAVFALNHYLLTYFAGAHGKVDGDTVQSIDHGGSGSAVTAVADEGYHFVQWSDGRSDNPRLDANVVAAITVEAQFAINTYTLAYSADSNGSIDGEPVQTVEHGEDGAPVTAVPGKGYHFLQWSDGRDDNPRVDMAVTSDFAVSAAFAINTYTVTASSSGNGTLSPTGAQTVEHGSDISFQVSPDPGFVAVVGGSCGGELDGNTYVTAPVIGDCTVDASFVAPVSLHIVTGDAQSAVIGMPFDQALRVLVLDIDAEPVSGVEITFMPPASGPSLLPAQATVTTGSDGIAALGVMANMTPGTYAVSASAPAYAAAAGVTFALENRLADAHLSVSVSDGRDHVRHGQVVDYLVEVLNEGPDAVTGLSIAMTLADSLDVSSATWQCLTAVSGCTPSGTGALQDSGLVLGVGEAAGYVVTVAVAADTDLPATTASVDITAPGLSAFAEDTTTLVIFRNGFNSEMDDGAKAVPDSAPDLSGPAFHGIGDVAVDPVTMEDDGIVTLLQVAGPANTVIRIDQLQYGDATLVRLAASDGHSGQASSWLRIEPDEPVLAAPYTSGGQVGMLLSSESGTVELDLGNIAPR